MATQAPKAITTDSYRQSVSEVIGTIRRATGLSDRKLAAELGCSPGTIRNARNQRTSLDPALLIRIEQEFGPGSIDPILALANIRAVALAQARPQKDPVLAIVAALHSIVLAEALESDGGRRITASELRKILPELRKGRAALDALIARAETRR